MDNKTLTPAAIAAIEARVEAATQGPWRLLYDAPDSQGQILVVADDELDACDEAWRVASVANHCGEPVRTKENAELIAHAPTDIRALLAALATAHQQRDEAFGLMGTALGHLSVINHYGFMVRNWHADPNATLEVWGNKIVEHRDATRAAILHARYPEGLPDDVAATLAKTGSAALPLCTEAGGDEKSRAQEVAESLGEHFRNTGQMEGHQ